MRAGPSHKRARLPWRPLRPRRRALLLAALMLGCWVALRAPAWASGAIPRSLDVVEGTFAARVAAYKSIYGSLTVDFSVALASFAILAGCAGTETAITTLWPWKVREYSKREEEAALERSERNSDRKARLGMWSALRNDIQRFMQTILTCATVSAVMSTAVVTEIFGQLFGPDGLAIAAFSVTLFQLILCEIMPKSVAVSHAHGFARATLPIFYAISAVLYPVSKVVNRVVVVFLRIFGVSVDDKATPFVSEEELDLVFSSAMQSGVVEPEEGEMIRSVRNLDMQKVKDVMTPLVDITGVEESAPITALYDTCMSTQFTRLPVYDTRIDRVTGIVSMKQLMKHIKDLTNATSSVKVQDICDTPFFVPETMSLRRALRVLQERTMAICVDEYGGTTGLVTLEDILEEIVGDIYDPDDLPEKRQRALRSSMVESLGAGRFLMSAAADVDDVSQALNIDIPITSDYNSIGGYMCVVRDHIPYVGEAIVLETALESCRLEAIEVEDRKIVKIEAVKLRRPDVEDEEAIENDDGRARIVAVTIENDVRAESAELFGTPEQEEAEEESGLVTEEAEITTEAGSTPANAEASDGEAPSVLPSTGAETGDGAASARTDEDASGSEGVADGASGGAAA